MVLAATANETCKENEVYRTCGTPCQEHCPAYNGRGQVETAPLHCVKMCKTGCFCAEGLVRDLKRNGACVQRKACLPL
ncbi:hypothetical protein TYRP_012147 [Tyrophagus putrescentiae]|nr:hypothetical protein TYRP_012147 [Tyrophagus putrescentiae]